MIDYTILLQGRIEIRAMDYWANNFPNSKIVVSIWDDDIDYDFPNDWVVVVNKKPIDRIGFGNFDLQLISTINGLNQINTNYVIKMRCDEYWSNVCEIVKLINEDTEKIICGSLFFRPVGMHPFHISDHILAGSIKNIKLMFESAYTNIINNFWKFPIPECQLGLAYMWNKDYKLRELITDINIYNLPEPTLLDSFDDNKAKELIEIQLKVFENFYYRIRNDLSFESINWKNVKKWIQCIEYSTLHMKTALKKSEYPKIDELTLLKKYFKIIDVELLKPYLCTCNVSSSGRVFYESEISNFDKEYCITKL
jgi:hypothetical protein